ncbi:hypothetical protein D3C72_1449420 [compost metagenome]
MDKHNKLDYPIDKLIKNSKIEIEKIHTENAKLRDMKKNDSDRYNELDEIAQQTGHSLWIQEFENFESIWYLEDELFAMYEMKIIYAFKHLEINMKKLISSAYKDASVNKQFKWENLKQYMNQKNIDVNTIKGYVEVNQLREVNNSLKHSNDHNVFLKKYFKEGQESVVTYDVLELFYNKVKNHPNIFLKDLAYKISKDLYEFDEDKITNIAKSLALRMDQATAQKVSEKLLNYYKGPYYKKNEDL